MNNLMKNIISLILLCILALMAFFISSCTKKDSDYVIKMGYMQVSTGLPLFVALENKLYEKEGLTVEGVMFESVNQAMDAMLTGRIDGIQGVGFTTFMAVEQNSPNQFKMFWTCADTKEKYTNGFLKQKGSPYNDIGELQGKKIGTYTGTTQLINLKVILNNLSLNPENDVEIIQVGRQLEVQAFAQNQFDFLFTIEPDVTIAIEKDIGETFIENPRVNYIYDPFVAGGAVVSTRFIEEYPDKVKKIISIANDAIDYITENEQEAKQYLPKFTPLTLDIAQKSMLYEFWKLGEQDQEAMQALADLYFNEGALDKKIDISTMILDINSL